MEIISVIKCAGSSDQVVRSIFLQNPGRSLPGPQSKREKLLRRGGEGGAGMLGPEYRSSPANIHTIYMLFDRVYLI